MDETIEKLLNNKNLTIDNIEIIKINCVTGPTWEQKNDQYRSIHKEIIELSERLDKLINSVNFDNYIPDPPF